MPRKGISYEQVAAACDILHQSQQLSVRAIQSRTGGSMTTVLKHYRRWQRKKAGLENVEQVISERLRHALLSDLEEAAARASETLQGELHTTRQQLSATRARAERDQDALLQQLKHAQHQRSLQQLRLGRREKLAAELKQELRRLQLRLAERDQDLRREQRLRRESEAERQALEQRHRAAEERLRAQQEQLRVLEERLQDPPRSTKEGAVKKRQARGQQSLFDF